MNTKALYAVAVIVAVISGGYYYFSGEREKLNVQKKSNMMYSATDVSLLKTDEQGQIELKATVDNLQQDLKTTNSEMNNIQAQAFRNGTLDAIFKAKKVNGYDDNQKVILSDGVRVEKTTPQGLMTFNTEQLTIYPKQRLMESEYPVLVDSSQAMFSSQGLKVDLNKGQYEFFKIRGQYER